MFEGISGKDAELAMNVIADMTDDPRVRSRKPVPFMLALAGSAMWAVHSATGMSIDQIVVIAKRVAMHIGTQLEQNVIVDEEGTEHEIDETTARALKRGPAGEA
jgi:hypothetical protein